MKPIYARDILYTILLNTVVNPATRRHYRHVVTRGKENLPQDGPYILAPCHQNALMDPLVLLQQLGGPIVFLARADIFKKPTLRAILTWLRIMPAFRIRDGREQLGRNAETFDKSVEVLLHNVPLCLMAEGTHNDKHQLRPLVKGMFRIAGEACRRLDGKPLYIVPVGMDYDEYELPYSSVCVEIGKPIDIRPFMQEYVENEPVALNRMRDALTTALKGVMHHVETTDNYEAEYAYCHLHTQEYLKEHRLKNNVWNRYQARKAISQSLPAVTACPHTGKVPLWFLSKGWTWWKSLLTLLGILLLVLVICGIDWQWLLILFIANPIVFLPTHLITHRIIKDPQFRSSINYGIRLALHILYLPILFLAVALIRGILWALALLALGILSAWVTPHLLALLRDTWYSLRAK